MVIHLFGDKLKELRISKNLSQEELSEILEVGKSSISNWETGKATPTFDMLTKIAQYFGVTIDYLLNFGQEDADNMKKLKVALKEAGMWDYDMDDMSKEDFEKAMKIVAMLKGKK
jgi:transcriptional regulator with XRE-family HTH domain|nr:MAG TPA: Repressor protein CI [Bacteriophage sp.]